MSEWNGRPVITAQDRSARNRRVGVAMGRAAHSKVLAGKETVAKGRYNKSARHRSAEEVEMPLSMPV